MKINKNIYDLYKVYISNSKFKILLIFFFVLLINIISSFEPILFKKLIDKAIVESKVDLICHYSILIISLHLIVLLLGILEKYLMINFASDTIKKFSIAFYKHIQSLDIKFFNNTKLGDILDRFNRDVWVLGETISQNAIEILTNIAMAIIVLCFMFVYNYKLTLISLTIFPLYIFIQFFFGAKIKKYYGQMRTFWSKLSSFEQEKLSGIRLIKENSSEEYVMSNYTVLQDGLKKSLIKNDLFTYTGKSLSFFCTNAGPVLLFLYGGILISKNEMTIGELIGFYYYVMKLFTPINYLVNNNLNLQEAKISFKRLYKYLNIEPKIRDNKNSVLLTGFKQSIILDNINFSYKSDKPVLRNLSLEIKKNQKIAFVGSSGSGKTTIINLLIRLYDVDSGSIMIDGVDLRNYNLNSLRKNIAIVSQDTILFNDTIFENLKYGKENATLEEIIVACKQANIYNFIKSLPDQFNTILGERGVNISGGQKQRISLARALLKNSNILIMDEATSNLDSESEKIIKNEIKNYSQNRTIIIVAHRLTTVVDCDNIIVLNKGEIIESGSHHNLLKQRGSYLNLWEKQFA